MPGTLSVEDAFAFCEARVRAHYENFPVGLFVPRARRPFVHALYAFARAADDFADEPMYEGHRTEKLDEWERRLHAAYAGQAEDPIFIALRETVRRVGIPKELLLDLLSAFRQDTQSSRCSAPQFNSTSRSTYPPIGTSRSTSCFRQVLACPAA